MKLFIGLLVLCLVIYISTFNWRRSIKAVLLLVVIEGVLRKWVLPQASDFIYFLKDFVLIGAYIKYYISPTLERRFVAKSNVLSSIILLVSVWCVFQAFNPSLGSPLVGVLGLRGYLLYIPLMWMIPNLFQSEFELKQFLKSYLILVIPVGLLAIAQFFSPTNSPLNVYTPGAGALQATFGDGHFIRVTGTFSFLANLGTYLLVCFSLLLPLIVVNQSRKWFWVTIVEILLIVISALMTGSRSVVFPSVLILISYLGIKTLTHPSRTLHLVKKVLLATVVIAIASSIWFKPSIDAFSSRTTNSSDSLVERITGSFTEPFDFVKYKGLDGYGTGATHQAASTLRRALDVRKWEVIPTFFESEMGRVILELGPFGFFLWYLLRVSLIISLWLVFYKLKRPFLQDLALAACLVHASQINGLLVFNHTLLVYYWFLSGFIFMLPRLEQIENLRMQNYLLSQQHE